MFSKLLVLLKSKFKERGEKMKKLILLVALLVLASIATGCFGENTNVIVPPPVMPPPGMW